MPVITRVNITFWDIVLIVCLLAVSGIWLVFILIYAQPGVVAEIHNKEGLFREISLDEDATITVPGPLGNSVVKIEDGSVFMLSSPCPGKVCMNFGKISHAGESIVCVPNQVYIVIRNGKKKADAISY